MSKTENFGIHPLVNCYCREGEKFHFASSVFFGWLNNQIKRHSHTHTHTQKSKLTAPGSTACKRELETPTYMRALRQKVKMKYIPVNHSELG